MIKITLRNPCFIIPLIFGCTLAILHCITQVNLYNQVIKSISEECSYMINPCLPIYSIYNLWIGNDESKYASVLFCVMPLLASIANFRGYSYGVKENKIRCTRDYILNYIVTFVLSGLIITIPLLLNFIVMSIFIPSITPDAVYDIYYGIFSESFLAYFFYTIPFLYIIIFIILNFIFYGLFGCLSFAVSTIIKHKIVSVLAPTVIILLIEVLKRSLFPDFSIEISPMSFLYPEKSNNANMIIILTEISLLLFFTLILPISRGEK